MNTFLELIHSRHSFRGEYQAVPVKREDLIKIMQAGIDAPSGCNKQTTSFIAIDDPHILKQLLNVIDPPIGQSAPAAICVLTQRIYAYRDKCFAIQDYSAAIENMLLAIIALGYQSCWYEGHITDEDQIGKKMAHILNVPDDYELVCFLPIGIPKEKNIIKTIWSTFKNEVKIYGGLFTADKHKSFLISFFFLPLYYHKMGFFSRLVISVKVLY